MEMERGEFTVRDLLSLYDNQMLKANPEYQRGIVWSLTQRKKLIDSVMREYPLPLIYLHHIKRIVAGAQRDDFEIIDGQQRIISLHEFHEGAYKLFDPIADDQEAKFPSFLKNQPCPWANKDFSSLTADLREKFLNTPLAIAKIYTENANEVRDLFVRLQAGLVLNAQETRDAWPGDFTNFILWLGGKPQITRYPGHSFFKRVMRMKPQADRGKTRTVAAQIASLFLMRREKGREHFNDISSGALDDFYYTHIDFDQKSQDAYRLTSILEKLDSLLGTGTRPKIRNHEAIHLVLLVDTLWDDYTRSWESTLASALDKFSDALALAKNNRYEDEPDEFWLRYGQWTRVNSDKAETIRRRHEFYMEKMLGFLQPLQLKDPKRIFGPLEREIIYFRDKKICARCNAPVAWDEAEIHHIKEHHDGGPTVLPNGALVHKHCHPKGSAAKAFAASNLERAPLGDIGAMADDKIDTPASPVPVSANAAGRPWSGKGVTLPHGTDLRMQYNGKHYVGQIDNGEWVIEGKRFRSPSAAAGGTVLTKSGGHTNLDGWIYWEAKRPGDHGWTPITTLRRDAAR